MKFIIILKTCEKTVPCKKEQENCTYCYNDGNGDCSECDPGFTPYKGKCTKVAECTKSQSHCKTCYDDGEGDCATCEGDENEGKEYYPDGMKCSERDECNKCGYRREGNSCVKGTRENSANIKVILAVLAFLMIIF